MRLLRTCVALLCVSQALARRFADVVFVADGGHDWGVLEGMLPPPKSRSSVVPSPRGEFGPESASCASEMATGKPGIRNMLGSGAPLGALAKASGAATGIVTDACALDPTVSAFFASGLSRFDGHGIAEALDSVDVLLGGSSRPLFRTESPCSVSTRAELARALPGCADQPLRGFFGNMKAALAAMCSPASNITLEDMTVAALSRLRATDAKAPFFLVVGGDQIDASSHTGDVNRLEELYRDFARAVSVAVAYVSLRPDARVIVTGDHETPLKGAAHSNASVPLLIYGAGKIPSYGTMPQTRVFDVVLRRA